jgi:hypothetical protein
MTVFTPHFKVLQKADLKNMRGDMPGRVRRIIPVDLIGMGTELRNSLRKRGSLFST